LEFPLKPLFSVSRRPLPLLVLSALLLGACLARGTRGAAALFTLTDPRGDDHGDGELRYPLRDDMPPGSLDLLSLTAFAEEDGTRFEAAFARPIARPQAGRTVDLAGETLAQRARHGFYTFNLDVYVDTDRAQGSGRTETLPGRYLTLSPAGAWEKAIVVAPRPVEARDILRGLWRKQAREEQVRTQGSLSESQQKAVDAAVERELEERVFFPTRMRVTGATLEFFVPSGFLGGAARPEWGYAAAVTGASIETKVNLPALFGKDSPPGLMVLPIGPGDSAERFGGGRLGDAAQSPVVDLLVPEGVSQEQVLGPNAPPWLVVVPGSTPPAP
jgi:hypothetical protein